MSKRMLIDDSQPEETRVVIVNGNKIEDVEFETAHRKQIKGNIYLAKVMRVEPSLQAAFVDYGGNKHGFLAFGEIHPDYYNVSDEVLAEVDREVEEIIEGKKQAIKEREEFKERQKEGREKSRQEYLHKKALEDEALKAEKKDASGESETETKGEPEAKGEPKKNHRRGRRVSGKDKQEAKEDVKVEVKAEVETKTEVVAEPVAEVATATATESEVETEVEAEEEVLGKDGKPLKKRLAKKRYKKNKDFKVMSLASAAVEEVVSEDFVPEKVNVNHEEDISDTDDDDDENDLDFELTRKLLKVRKLYHKSSIQDVIKEGQILLVQVVKEERGNKGAALTTYLSLAGRYCVFMPNRIKSGGVSRKITNMNDRKRLKAIVRELPITADMSMIVRTAGEEKTKADIVRDYNYLIRSWNQVRIGTLKAKAPALVHEEGNLIKRALRDMYTKDISEIIVEGDAGYRVARDFTKILSPHNLKKLKSCKSGEIPLFQRFQVEVQLDKLHDSNVQLASGGYLVINPTEALVAIDVNSGRATKEKDLEETALKTNLEAADEIAKQLRLRNLAGLVVIDFIDMDEPRNNAAVEKRMKEALKNDRARIQIGKMSCFGLLEISRQRMHSSFFENNYHTCPYCKGKGIVRSTESGAVLILRAIEEEGIKNRSSKVNIFVPTEHAIYLLNHKRSNLFAIESRYKMNIVVSADDSIKNIADFRIERTKAVRESNVTQETVDEINALEKTKEEVVAAVEADNTPKPENERVENNGRRERGGRRRDRRNGRSGQRDGRRPPRRNEENSEYKSDYKSDYKKDKPSEKAVILYNSHGNTSSVSASGDGSSSENKQEKSNWWKKLISK